MRAAKRPDSKIPTETHNPCQIVPSVQVTAWWGGPSRPRGERPVCPPGVLWLWGRFRRRKGGRRGEQWRSAQVPLCRWCLPR
jgi:hypothetical protein